MRGAIEAVTDQSLTWPDAAVIVVLLICCTGVFITMIRGD